ncbi:MAG: benzoyl-CoA-dihydrodiol lyase [Planctomycetes bacterium]|nr:benzoyl-CoA-dihydrodiol lyase [Planctomycetota bacterium]
MKTENLQRHPDSYIHWKLDVQGDIAWMRMNVQTEKGFRPGYILKLNSYDLGVDLELADAISRLRFEHPQVKVLAFTSAQDRIFCSGANIFMLQSSTHAFKVNFCKFTNETRLTLEEYARESGVRTLAALNGTASGGGYELAIACDEIHLIEDGNAAVSLPEVPLLGVLPGTGGLTRLVDKRKIRRDLADVFSTLAEGLRGPRAVKWGLIDASHAKSKFDDKVKERLAQIASTSKTSKAGAGMKLSPIEATGDERTRKYQYVTLDVDDAARVATITIDAPSTLQPTTPDELRKIGDQAWIVKAWRELDDAILQLRLMNETVGVIILKTRGSHDAVLAADKLLLDHGSDWLVHEVRLLVARVLRRVDNTSKSLFAIVDEGSCFVGSLFELAIAADRSFMLNDGDGKVTLRVSAMSDGRLPMSHCISRLACRFLRDPPRVARVLERTEALDADAADELGLVTFTPDDIDWEDEVRIAIEERASYSPDALTGMEQNLRFAGAESVETKIFGRLSAWQNWIFTRPNATGEHGALTAYGKPARPTFDWKRT